MRRRCSKASTISAAFAASDDRDEGAISRVRTIFCSRLVRKEALLVYRVTGSGFLKHMVRNLVGVLVEVGKGNLSGEDVLARLRPACGIAARSDGSGERVVSGFGGVRLRCASRSFK